MRRPHIYLRNSFIHYTCALMAKTNPVSNEAGEKEEEISRSKLSSIKRALSRTATLESKLEDLIATLHIKGVRSLFQKM